MEFKRKKVREILSNHSWILAGFCAVVILYIIAFVVFQSATNNFIDRVFGIKGFGASVSASILASLIFFIVFGFFASIISTAITTIEIEDHNYDRRTRALMNSSQVADNENAHIF